MQELKVKLEKEHKLEKTFTSDFIKGLKNKGFFAFKLPDGSLGMKPFDLIVSTHINSYYIEIKVIDNDIFNLNILRDNQWNSLKNNYDLKNNNKSLIIIYSKKKKDYKIINFEQISNQSRNARVLLKFD